MFVFVQLYCNGKLHKNPISIFLLRYRRKTFTIVNIGQISQIFSQYHKGLLKRFRSTGGFFNNSAIILKLNWPEKTKLLYFEIFSSCRKERQFPKEKCGRYAYYRHQKRRPKCRNSTRSPYWRSVEYQNGTQVEACGFMCNRSKLSGHMKKLHFQDLFLQFSGTLRYLCSKRPNDLQQFRSQTS